MAWFGSIVMGDHTVNFRAAPGAGVRVEPPDYSGGTPTDPDEWISLIRFLRIRFR
jgi:hypothetical protein